MSDDVVIRVRVANDTKSGLSGAERDARSSGQRAGKGFSDELKGGLKDVGDAASSAATGLARMGVGAAIIGWAPGAAAALVLVAGAAAILPAALGAAAAAASAFGFAISGIGDAVSAGWNPKSGGGGGGGPGAAAAGNARQIRDATAAIDDAREQARRTARNTSRDIIAAEKSLVDAEKSGAREIADAKREQARSAKDSERQVADALSHEQDALAALDDARKRAGEELDALKDKVNGYALTEEGAQLRLQKALAAQRKVNRDVTSTYLERQTAAYDVKVAQAALTQTEKDGAKNAADLVTAQAKGVEGSALVVSAKKNAAAAAQNVADAEETAAQRREDSARHVADAETDSASRIAAARESLAQTEESAAERNADAQKSVASALQHLQDAQDQQAASAGAAAGGVNKFAKAMKELSPEAQELVRAIIALKPAWDDMAHSIQDRALNGLAEDVKALAGTYIPLLKSGLGGVADGLNAMARYAVDALMDPATVANLSTLFDNTALAIQKGSTALGDFLTGFIGMASVGSQYLPAIAQWVSDIAQDFTDWANSADGASQMQGWIEGAAAALQTLWDIGGNVLDVITGIFSGLGGGTGGQDFLQMVADMTQSLADFVNSDGVQSTLGFLGELARMIFDNIGWVLILAGVFQGVAWTLGLVKGAVEAYEAAVKLAKIATEIWKGAQIALNFVMEMNPIGIVVLLIAALVAAIIYAYTHFQWFRDLVNQVWGAIVAAFNWGLSVAQAALTGIAGFFDWLGGRIGAFADWAGGVLGDMWAPLGTGLRVVANGAIFLLNGLIRSINFAIRGMNMLGAGLPEFGQVPYLAKGGIAGGLAMVGENGPELVNLPQGSTVYPAGQSKRMAEQGGGSGGGSVQVELVAGKGANGAVATMIMSLIRSGDLQLKAS